MRLTHSFLCAGLAIAAFGQSAADLPEFEAASIKPNKSGSGSSSDNASAGQFVGTNVSLREYVRLAFRLKDYQISAPDWLSSEKFDIVAKFPPHAGDNLEGPRLQKLLIDRFKLAVHRETKEFPVYALVLGKNGPKIQAVEDEGSHGTNSKRGHLSATRTSMARLAEFLARQMDRPVVDQTDLPGVFTFTLDWSPDEAAAAADVAAFPPLLTALQQQLGLKLQPSKAPLELLIVDHIEKVPVEN